MADWVNTKFETMLNARSGTVRHKTATSDSVGMHAFCKVKRVGSRWYWDASVCFAGSLLLQREGYADTLEEAKREVADRRQVLLRMLANCIEEIK